MDELVIEVLRMLLAHPQGAVIIVAAIVVAGIVVMVGLVNGSMKGAPTSLLGVALDAVSLLTRKDAHGTLKLPGTRSKHAPEAVPVVVEETPGESSK